MNEVTRRRLALACCAAMALAVSSCGDDSGSSSQKCGDQVCTELQKCVDDVCKDLCGTEVCAEDKVCDEATQTCIDKPVDPCSLCTETQQCVDKVCKDLCGTEVCGEDKVCDEATQTCIDKVVDPCATVNCLANQTCMNGRCYDDGCLITGEDGSVSEMTCDEGQECSKGACIDSLCKTLKEPCADGWQCIKGICEETACLTQHCNEGQSCRGGNCIDNECLDVTCNDGKVCSKGNCLYPKCIDKEACATGKTCNEEGDCVYIANPAISLDEPSDKTTDEKGKTISLALHLNNAPSQEVRVTCEVVPEFDPKEVEVSCGEIVFNADNWQHEQSIIVTGVEDYLLDGNKKYTIKVTTTSEDKDFDALIAESVELTNLDTTKPGFVLSETSLLTYEDQTADPAKFTIALASIPSSDVSLKVASSDDTEGTVSTNSLTFTKDNWNVPQEITVTGVDDAEADGNQNYTVYFVPATSKDNSYQGLQAPPVKVTNVDNDKPGMSMNLQSDGFELTEGQFYPLTLKLNTIPKNDVKIALTVDDATEAAFDVAEITVKAEDWNKGTEIQLMGVADHIIDGEQPVVLTLTATSEDAGYNFSADYVGKVKDIDTAELAISYGDSLIVTEGSEDAVKMSLSLSSQPTSDVTVEITIVDDTEIKADKTTITIAPDNWNVPNDVLVSSVDDALVDGNVKSIITLKLTSEDTNFNGLSKEVEFTTVDNDEAGFVVTSTAASYAENSGATDAVTVALKAQPEADVTVTVASSDSTELAVTSESTLTFTKENWNTPQTVNVKVVDDNLADGQQTAYVSFIGASEDPHFNDIKAQSENFTIIDNDSATVALVANPEIIGQASPMASATITLGAEPVTDVTLTLKAEHTDIITFDPPTLTFTKSNWNTPQNITVNVNFDEIAYASVTENIWATASGDESYSGVESKPVVLTLIKIPTVQNFEYTGDAQTVTLPAAKYKLEVWGAQGGESATNFYAGKGGYASGTVTLTKATQVFIYVGGRGTDTIFWNASGSSCKNSSGTEVPLAGGFNGGGECINNNVLDGCPSGGGATHIATSSGLLSSLSSDQSSVLIVAGAGGAGTVESHGGYGGGETGGIGTPSIYFSDCHSSSGCVGYGGTQTAGGEGGLRTTRTTETTGDYATAGSFGQGGRGYYRSYVACMNFGGGGGGGWYGGGGTYGIAGAGGGSSYVEPSLINTQLTAGNVSMPAPAGSTENGHAGNGYARITLLLE
ncbi:MAG: hypothetical protein IJU23_01200 [Proteobacteria bacterium]|nr:hypothetical protein [Pseudomonadota bacterium]